MCKNKFFALNSIRSEIVKCIGKKPTRQFVLIAERNAKFLLNQTEASQYTAENAIPNEDHHEDIKLISQNLTFVSQHFFFFIPRFYFLTTNDNK
jgi:hypothetical protein